MTDHLQRKWTADLQFLHRIIDSFRELKWNIESRFGGGCLKWIGSALAFLTHGIAFVCCNWQFCFCPHLFISLTATVFYVGRGEDSRLGTNKTTHKYTKRFMYYCQLLFIKLRTFTTTIKMFSK